MSRRPKILIVCGYFDWFSGYQEVGLAESLSKIADVTVLAGNRVSPAFADSHLARIGTNRKYSVGTHSEHGVTVIRLPTTELRSMVWALGIGKVVRSVAPEGVIQVMPGQLLPALASASSRHLPRAVLYGDNSAMWAGLTPRGAALKWAVFASTKGRLYKYVNRRATAVYGYTPETVTRLASFVQGGPMRVMPLAFRAESFFCDLEQRQLTRHELGLSDDDIAVLVAGKVQKQKRIDVVAAAVAEARRRSIPARLVIAGNDDSTITKSILSDAITSNGLSSEHVVKVGFLSTDRLNAIFNAADIGVWPAMPAITIQQAMGTGLRVVLPHNDYVSHLLTTSDSGCYLQPQGDLVSQIVGAIPRNSESHSQRLSRAAQNAWLSSDRLAEATLADLGLFG